MDIGVITLFPEMFALLKHGVVGRSLENRLITFNTWNPRDYTTDKYRTVDDRPYGGGPGMLMKVQPLEDALNEAKSSLNKPASVIYVSPQGRKFDHKAAKLMSAKESLIFIAGRYEGIDERFISAHVDEEWSIGDYVLTGGEIAITVMIDAIARFIPGVLGAEASAEQDSFANGLLDCSHYTRPEIINGMKVPEVLCTGNHKAIDRWRMKQSLGRTWIRRPDLLEKITLTEEQEELLKEFIDER